jgi:hypothetical protein
MPVAAVDWHAKIKDVPRDQLIRRESVITN